VDMNGGLKQNTWFRAFLEGVVIVGSILLAFGIEAWWDRHNERLEETSIVSGLHDQFSRHKEQLNEMIEYQKLKVTTVQDLLLIIQQNQWEKHADRIDTLLGIALRPATMDLGDGVLESTISSGHLDFISDQELRLKLVRWEGVLGEASDDEIVIRNIILDKIFPYLTGKGLPMGGSLEKMVSSEWPIPKRTLAGDPQKLNALCMDPVFAALLEELLGFTMHSGWEYQNTLQTIDEILDNLEHYEGHRVGPTNL